MSDFTRRTFLKGLSSAFGAASITDLEARILDNNAPILLKPTHVSNKFFVAENGQLALGDIWTPDEMKPVTWLQYFVDIGAKTKKDVRDLATGWDVEDVEASIDEENWFYLFDDRYRPLEAAYYFLKQNKIGTALKNKHKIAGRLDFFAGSNHPGSRDLWCEAFDDLSVSLLQANLIELGHPIEIVMEQGRVWKEYPDAYGDEPWDE